MNIAHLVAAALLIVCGAALPWRVPGIAAPIATGLAATAAWNLLRINSSMSAADEPVRAAAIILCVEVSAVALFLGTYRLVRGRLPRSARTWALLVAIPALVAVGLAATFAAEPSDRPSVILVLHLSFAFALVGATVLTLRLRTPSRERHVAVVVGASQALLVAAAVTMSVRPDATSLVGAGWCLLMTWAARRHATWDRVTTVTSTAMDTLDVLVLVTDARGRLLEWNATADRTLTLMTKQAPLRGMDVASILGVPSPFPDGALLDLEFEGATLPVELSVRDRLPGSAVGDQVLMLIPLDQPPPRPKNELISGALTAHDPATQTQARTPTLRELREAAERGRPVLRCEVSATGQLAADDLLFVLARRLEAHLPEWTWGRPDEWLLVGTSRFDAPADLASVVVDDLPLHADLDAVYAAADETPDAFVRRVLSARLSGQVRQGDR